MCHSIFLSCGILGTSLFRKKGLRKWKLCHARFLSASEKSNLSGHTFLKIICNVFPAPLTCFLSLLRLCRLWFRRRKNDIPSTFSLCKLNTITMTGWIIFPQNKFCDPRISYLFLPCLNLHFLLAGSSELAKERGDCICVICLFKAACFLWHSHRVLFSLLINCLLGLLTFSWSPVSPTLTISFFINMILFPEVTVCRGTSGPPLCIARVPSCWWNFNALSIHWVFNNAISTLFTVEKGGRSFHSSVVSVMLLRYHKRWIFEALWVVTYRMVGTQPASRMEFVVTSWWNLLFHDHVYNVTHRGHTSIQAWTLPTDVPLHSHSHKHKARETCTVYMYNSAIPIRTRCKVQAVSTKNLLFTGDIQMKDIR